MGQAITAMYEQGILRPLTPLRLKERSLVQIQVVSEPLVEDTEREETLRVLMEAGVIRPHPAAPPRLPVDEVRLAAARRALGAAGPLSELIIAERDGR